MLRGLLRGQVFGHRSAGGRTWPAGQFRVAVLGIGVAQASAAELSRLIEAANAVCEQDSKKPELVVLRRLSSA